MHTGSPAHLARGSTCPRKTSWPWQRPESASRGIPTKLSRRSLLATWRIFCICSASARICPSKPPRTRPNPSRSCPKHPLQSTEARPARAPLAPAFPAPAPSELVAAAALANPAASRELSNGRLVFENHSTSQPDCCAVARHLLVAITVLRQITSQVGVKACLRTTFYKVQNE